MGQEEALVDAARKEEVLKDGIEGFTNVKSLSTASLRLRWGKKNFSSWKGGWLGVGLWGEGGIAVFRERPGDDVEGRGKEDLGQIIICDG